MPIDISSVFALLNILIVNIVLKLNIYFFFVMLEMLSYLVVVVDVDAVVDVAVVVDVIL